MRDHVHHELSHEDYNDMLDKENNKSEPSTLTISYGWKKFLQKIGLKTLFRLAKS